MTDHRPPLDVAAVRRDLVGPHRALRSLDVVQTTGSTNADLLARRAAGQDIDGAVLVAEHQSAGRGRAGRSWSTPPRSQIAVSLGVGVAGLPSTAWGWLPLLTGVAAVDAVRATTGIRAGLKWPNDILVGERKLGGILAEVAAPEPAAAAVVLAIDPEEPIADPQAASTSPPPRAPPQVRMRRRDSIGSRSAPVALGCGRVPVVSVWSSIMATV